MSQPPNGPWQGPDPNQGWPQGPGQPPMQGSATPPTNPQGQGYPLPPQGYPQQGPYPPQGHPGGRGAPPMNQGHPPRPGQQPGYGQQPPGGYGGPPPTYGYGAPPPPERKGRGALFAIIAGIVAAALIAGAFFLWPDGDDGPDTSPSPTTVASSDAPSPSAEPSDRPSDEPTPSPTETDEATPTPEPTNGAGQAVTMHAESPGHWLHPGYADGATITPIDGTRMFWYGTSPDGAVLAYYDDFNLHGVSTATGDELWFIENRSCARGAWAGMLLCSWNDGRSGLEGIDITTGDVKFTVGIDEQISGGEFIGSDSDAAYYVLNTAWDEDPDDHFVLATNTSGEVIWNQPIGQQGEVDQVVMASDGQVAILRAERGHITVIDRATGTVNLNREIATKDAFLQHDGYVLNFGYASATAFTWPGVEVDLNGDYAYPIPYTAWGATPSYLLDDLRSEDAAIRVFGPEGEELVSSENSIVEVGGGGLLYEVLASDAAGQVFADYQTYPTLIGADGTEIASTDAPMEYSSVLGGILVTMNDVQDQIQVFTPQG